MRKDQIFKIEPRRENINRTSRPFKITATFQKEGKNANFRINKDHLLRIGKLRLFKISHPHSFFRQLILRDTPCLSALCARVEKRSGKTKRFSAKVRKRSKCKVYLGEADLSTGYPQVSCGYPARHPSIVARFFTLVKGKFKIIHKKTRRLSVPRGHLSGLASSVPCQ